MQGRNFPVHFLFRFARPSGSPACSSVAGRELVFPVRVRTPAKFAALRKPERASCTRCRNTNHYSPLTNHAFLPGVPKTLRVLGWLPGTVTRVETHLSPRKQTTAHPSTRNVPAHVNFRLAFPSTLPIVSRIVQFIRCPRTQVSWNRKLHPLEHNSGSRN